MKEIKSVCVFCGAASRVEEEYHQLARQMGRALADDGLALVYGGSRTGTMGSLADGALGGGGRVVGYIPRHLEEREQQHQGITECHVVDSMHERKRGMVDASDAFVILPGGFGTMDEFFENITWRQIGLHDKPIIIVNYKGFWDTLIALIHGLEKTKFIRPENLELFTVVETVDAVIPAIRAAKEVRFDPNSKWM